MREWQPVSGSAVLVSDEPVSSQDLGGGHAGVGRWLCWECGLMSPTFYIRTVLALSSSKG